MVACKWFPATVAGGMGGCPCFTFPWHVSFLRSGEHKPVGLSTVTADGMGDHLLYFRFPWHLLPSLPLHLRRLLAQLHRRHHQQHHRLHCCLV